ncbi:MAG: site-specific integrase [Acidimicrobiia bacterium]
MRGHIRARTGTRGTSYELRVYAGIEENGRRRYIVETFRGTKRDAERRLTQLIAAADAGQTASTSKARLHELVDAWWEACTGHLSPHTRIGYRGMLRRYVLPTFGSRRIDKLKPLELERWYAQLVAGTTPISDRQLSPLTVRKIHTLLSGILSTAVRWGWLPVSPLERVRAPRAVLKTMRAPEPEEIARALDAALEFDDELHLFLRLSAALGTRRGETAALRWCDVDLDAGDVHVHRALAPVEANPKQVLEKGTKTHANARLSIDEETVVILRRYRARAVEIALACGVALDDDSYVFSPEPDRIVPWHPDHFGKQWERLRKKVGLDHVRLHDWRHFHGTELASAGVPMTVVRDRLRHSNIRTTSMYAHSRRALDRQAADAIGNALKRARQ